MMNNKFILLLLTVIIPTQTSYSQAIKISLWGDNVPNQRSTEEKEIRKEENIVLISNVQNPEIEVYLPSKRNATGEAVLIFPGGGYHVLAYDWEGEDVAKLLNSNGIAGIVVKYRLPVSKSIIEPYKAPLQDAQRAIRIVRTHALDWNISPDKIGIMGFSAGGHLASTLGTHYNENIYEPRDSTDTASARPDFMALVYPVILFKGPDKHSGSEDALLGKDPDQKLVQHFSNDLQVNKETPRTFLLHAGDDDGVPVENSLKFYGALNKNDVPAELHIFPKGGHGFGLGLQNPELSNWPSLFIAWLRAGDE